VKSSDFRISVIVDAAVDTILGNNLLNQWDGTNGSYNHLNYFNILYILEKRNSIFIFNLISGIEEDIVEQFRHVIQLADH